MGASSSEGFDIDAAVRFLERRESSRRAARRELFRKAVADCTRIVAMIASEFRPRRVYQWGSLLDPERFDESSDIDIAVEGLSGARAFLDLQGKALGMTGFALDLVEIEQVEPVHRESILERGKVVYEREESTADPAS
jgi:predicted nucleotidyltransferase